MMLTADKTFMGAVYSAMEAQALYKLLKDDWK